MISEREHWLSITDDPEWKRSHITDPNISLDETVDAIVSAFPKKPQRIVEIGCGYGRLTREVRRRYPKASIWGVDVNPAVLVEARRYDPKTRFMCDDTLWSLGGVDAVYSVAVFQHLTDNEKHAYITQAYDALAQGGVLRVQFIEGVRDLHLDHWVAGEQMVLWAHAAGFSQTRVVRGVVHPQWCWLTATRPGA